MKAITELINKIEKKIQKVRDQLFFQVLKFFYFSKSAVDLDSSGLIVFFGTKLKVRDFSTNPKKKILLDFTGAGRKLTFNEKNVEFFCFLNLELSHNESP